MIPLGGCAKGGGGPWKSCCGCGMWSCGDQARECGGGRWELLSASFPMGLKGAGYML